MQIAVYLDRQTDRQTDMGDAFCLFYKEDTS